MSVSNQKKTPEPSINPPKNSLAIHSSDEGFVRAPVLTAIGLEEAGGRDMRPTGKLEDGTEFDSSLPQNQPFVFSFGTGQVIKGWDQGLLGMCEGEKQKLMMPSELGYGKRGAPPKIPGGATLVFEVEVLKIERRSEL
ncbi:peptidyl-prolyl cis-trans isomerase FKBP2-like [Rattus norvegicus]|uniref:peptidyl-prolyl cis-trans isomerase FKBP2-like n=1 Tax=Rattus norvegicus TaxID=10116 RepID=UPI0019179D2B|nr:peptidyl-prolyl cis-trans isomerase FKBP2-like [Rattus norvegicus]